MPKRKASAAQLRNLAKGRRKLAAMRRAGKVTRKKRPSTRARPRRRNPDDVSPEAWELILYAETRAEMMPNRDHIIKNVIRKINRGVYDKSKAPALWKYWMDDAAKRYTKEFDSPGASTYGIFNASVRREAAAWLAPKFYDEIMLGNYDHLIPLKKKTAKKRGKKRGPMTVKKRNPAFGNFQTARNVLKTGRTTNPARNGKKAYIILKSMGASGKPSTSKSRNVYDGKSWVANKKNAAVWHDFATVKRIAQAVADKSGDQVIIGVYESGKVR